MVNQSVALFVPLLLAVTTTLASFLRESVDLVTAVNEERPSFPFLSKVAPPLGRFTFIHIINILLLLIGILIVKDLSTNEATAPLSSIIFGIFLLVLPIIEINEYDSILSENSSDRLYPKSYYCHCASMVFLSLSFFGFVELQAIILNFFLLRGFTISGTILWMINRVLEFLLFPSVVVGIWFLYLFLDYLSDEIRLYAN